MKALIIYDNQRKSTRRFADAIAYKIQRRFESIEVKNFDEATPHDISGCDVLYLGGGAGGKWIVGPRPSDRWKDFVTNLPAMEGKKTVLFATYSLAAGNIFRSMKEYLLPKKFKVIGSMKSRLGEIDYNSFSVLRYSVTY